MIKNRKGILGMESVQSAMVLLLTLTVVAIAMFVGLNAVINSSSSLQDETVTDNAFVNQTIRLNHSATAPSAVSALRGVVLSNVVVTNATGAETISSGNYTISGGTFVTTNAANYNNTNINISASYTYKIDADATVLMNNLTNGTTVFFNNIPTVMTILGAVIIVLAISLILWAISRYSSGVSL